MAKPVEMTLTLRFNNNGADSLAVWLEPWCEHYSFPPAATFDVIAKGPADAVLEIDYEPARLTIYGWSGSVVRLFRNGKELPPETPLGTPTVKSGDGGLET